MLVFQVNYEIFVIVMFYCSTIKWNYSILDEGHIIKNSKTKVIVALHLNLY